MNAKETGKTQAERFLRKVITLSQEAYTQAGQETAREAFTSAGAQRNFLDGWMSVKLPVFVEGDRVTLTINIMNIEPRPLEEQLYQLFAPDESTITHVSTDTKCVRYILQTSLAVLNRPECVQFLQQKRLNYKIMEG